MTVKKKLYLGFSLVNTSFYNSCCYQYNRAKYGFHAKVGSQ